jgi:mRNA-degrading endonuclease RelE of RelBE toxin-antitoxin system
MSEPEQWTVTYHRDLEREIRRLPRPFIKRILETIESLAADPRPPGCKKIEGHHFLNHAGIADLLPRLKGE